MVRVSCVLAMVVGVSFNIPARAEEPASPAAPNSTGCTKDTDCKGDRICVERRCVSPAGSSAAPSAHNQRPRVTGSPSGWSVGAAVLGFISTAAALGLHTGAAVTIGDHNSVGEIIGPVGAVLVMAMGPTTASGGWAARAGTPVWGCMGCRISGWVLYGIHAASSISLMITGIGFEIEPHPAQVGVTGLVGATALVLFASDSLVSRSQAYDYYQGNYQARAKDTERVPDAITWTPVIAPTTTPDGRAGAVFGIAGAF